MTIMSQDGSEQEPLAHAVCRVCELADLDTNGGCKRLNVGSSFRKQPSALVGVGERRACFDRLQFSRCFR